MRRAGHAGQKPRNIVDGGGVLGLGEHIKDMRQVVAERFVIDADHVVGQGARALGPCIGGQGGQYRLLEQGKALDRLFQKTIRPRP